MSRPASLEPRLTRFNLRAGAIVEALVERRGEVERVLDPDVAVIAVGDLGELFGQGEAGEVQALSALFSELIELLGSGQPLSAESIDRAIEMLKSGEGTPTSVFSDVILSHRGKTIRPTAALRVGTEFAQRDRPARGQGRDRDRTNR